VIHRVASPGDPRLEPYRHVGNPGWLRGHGLFVAEGRLVVERLLEADRFEVHSILVSRAAHAAMQQPLSSAATDVYICDDAALASITGFNFHRGCLAIAARPAPLRAEALLGATHLLALEGVGNPDNVGGLFRTGSAFGVDGVLLGPSSGDPLYRKAIRTSMAATLRVRFAHADPWPAGLQPFRDAGFRIVALTPHPSAETLETHARALALDPAPRLILLVGSEGAGLQEPALQFADARVRIPIDPSVDSLNVVVAAGIALERLRPPQG
jgi:tRNA G18 (ribose-2'-O)-methylase SpoU